MDMFLRFLFSQLILNQTNEPLVQSRIGDGLVCRITTKSFLCQQKHFWGCNRMAEQVSKKNSWCKTSLGIKKGHRNRCCMKGENSDQQ
jgi:hypothetical protein